VRSSSEIRDVRESGVGRENICVYKKEQGLARLLKGSW